MKIFLTNPPTRIPISERKERFFVRSGCRWPNSVIKNKDELYGYRPFPFYLAYAAALLRRDEHEIYCYDATVLNHSREDLLRKIRQDKPEIILFETFTPTFNYDLELIDIIKEADKNVIICLTGTHVSAFPEGSLNKSDNIDFIFLREYELNFLNFCRVLRENGPDYDRIKNIDGIGFKRQGKITVNPGRLIENLDELPRPAYDLFPANERGDPRFYWDGFCQLKPAVQMHSSRGCPFKCNFCMWNQVMYNEGKYRMFSPRRVVDEMQYLIDTYEPKEIYFDDDSFTINKKHVLAICDEIRKRGLQIKWSVMGDFMACDEEMLGNMADAGCIGMKFGVESANPELLKMINKPVDLQKVEKLARYASKLKMRTHATFTLGVINETEKSMKRTLDYAKELSVDTVQFSITVPYPGTKYFEYLKNNNMLHDYSWENFDVRNYRVAVFKDLSLDKLISFHQKAFRSWLIHKILTWRWPYRQIYYFFRMWKYGGFNSIRDDIIGGLQVVLKMKEANL